jgi:hypothetical protein
MVMPIVRFKIHQITCRKFAVSCSRYVFVGLVVLVILRLSCSDAACVVLLYCVRSDVYWLYVLPSGWRCSVI